MRPTQRWDANDAEQKLLQPPLAAPAALWLPAMVSLSKTSQLAHAPERLRLGFVPLTDCAPLVVAQELGFFARHGVEVTLSRELGWASVRDKLLFGELDAAHALAPLVFLLALGLGASGCACSTPLMLNAQGNAITVSRSLWEAGVRDADCLRAWRKHRRQFTRLTFGIVFPYSSHHLLLRDWLASAGLDIARDVRLVVVPPPQMVSNLKGGHLDGFCAGEPWNTVAMENGVGHCAGRSGEICPMHPEKVLLFRNEILATRAAESRAVAAAVLDACQYCSHPAHADAIAELLVRRHLPGVSRSAVATSLRGAAGHAPADRAPDVRFYGPEVNEPTLDKAGTLARGLRQAGLLPQPLRPAQLNALFRSDLYHQIRPPKPVLNSSQHETENNLEIAPALV